MPDFRNLDYLRKGNLRQREVHALLARHHIMEKLAPHQALLTGTFPIGIDLKGSDLDIACFWTSKGALEESCERHFSSFPDYVLKHTIKRGWDTLLVRFQLESYPVEIFGQGRPVEEQESYRHMLIEHALLEQKGATFRQEILRLKSTGLSTEAAFARKLGLEGDPYQSLLDYKAGSGPGCSGVVSS